MTKIEYVPVDLIVPHPHNPRRDLGNLAELVDSIRVQGIRQNLLLVPYRCDCVKGDEAEDCPGPNSYTVVIGHRRLAAAKLAELEDVPCVIDDTLDEAGQIELMLLENLQREGISPVEEAEGYQQLLDLGVKPKDIVRMTGRAASTIHARLQLLKLPEKAREKVHAGQATLDDAADLQKLEGHPAELERVARALGTSNFDFELKNAKTRIARDETLAPLYAEAERLGAVRGEWDWQKHDRLGDANTVEQVTALAPFPEGTIYGPASYSPFIYLWSPKSAEELALRAARENATEAQQAEWREQREQAAEREAAIKEEGVRAWELREEWIVAFTGRKRVLAKEQMAIVAAIAPFAIREDGFYTDPTDLAEWLGLADDEWSEADDLLPVFDRRCPSLDRSLCLLVALHLATKNAYWQRAYSDHQLVALYGLLEQLGYPVSDAERARITPPADDEDEVA